MCSLHIGIRAIWASSVLLAIVCTMMVSTIEMRSGLSIASLNFFFKSIPRRYAGVSHIDAERVNQDDAYAEHIVEYAKKSGDVYKRQLFTHSCKDFL